MNTSSNQNSMKPLLERPIVWRNIRIDLWILMSAFILMLVINQFDVCMIWSLWPTTGVLLAVLIIRGWRSLPVVFLASLVAALTLQSQSAASSQPQSFVVMLVVFNVLANVLCFSLYSKFLGRNNELIEDVSILKFYGLVVFVGGAVAPALGLALTYLLSSVDLTHSQIFHLWIVQTTSMAVLTPITLILCANPKNVWRQRIKNTALPIAVSTVIVFAVSWLVKEYEQKSALEQHTSVAKDVVNYTQFRLTQEVDSLSIFKTFIESNERFSREEFFAFSQQFHDESQYIVSISLFEYFEHSQRDAFEKALKAIYPEFDTIRSLNASGQLVIDPGRETYLAITFNYPEVLNGFGFAMGINSYGSTSPINVTNVAVRDHGVTMISDPFIPSILADDENIKMLAVVSPLFDSDISTGQFSHKETGYRGNVITVINLNELFHWITQPLKDSGFSLCVFQIAGDGSRMVVYDGNRSCHEDQYTRVYEQETFLGGKQWLVYAVMPKSLPQEQLSLVIVVDYITASFLIYLIAIWFLSISGRNYRVEVMVAERTHQLSQEISERKVIEKQLINSNTMLMVVYDGLSCFFSKGDKALDLLLNELLNLSSSDYGMVFEVPDEVTSQNKLRLWFSESFPDKERAKLNAESNVKIIENLKHWDKTIDQVLLMEETEFGQRHPLTTPEENRIHDEMAYTVSLPITQGDKVLGVVWLCSQKPYDGFFVNSIQPFLITCATVLVGLKDSYLRQKLHSKLAFQASHDKLTGMYNRVEFEHRLNVIHEQTLLNGGEHVVCYMDLDQFKQVNDTCGHYAGDELLRQLSQIIKKHVRANDTVARMGGDEFAILLEGCPAEVGVDIAEKIRSSVEEYRFTWDKKQFAIGVSIGVVPMSQNDIDVANIMKAADLSCYKAKEKGRNCLHVFMPEQDNPGAASQEIEMKSIILNAIKEDHFRLYAQPIVRLVDGGYELTHFEILIRIAREEDDSLIFPDAFIPVAERCQLAVKMDKWVVEHALKFCAEHANNSQFLPSYSINLSGQTLSDPDFLSFVEACLQRYKVSSRRICFEVTETTAVQNMSRAVNFIQVLKGHGCQFALDDFGSGLSSFAYLKHLPVDYLKIDGMFVKDMCEDDVDFAMVKSINEIGHILGKETIAEFVENEDITKALHDIGVNYSQGYYIGKPQPILEAYNTWKDKLAV